MTFNVWRFFSLYGTRGIILSFRLRSRYAFSVHDLGVLPSSLSCNHSCCVSWGGVYTFRCPELGVENILEELFMCCVFLILPTRCTLVKIAHAPPVQLSNVVEVVYRRVILRYFPSRWVSGWLFDFYSHHVIDVNIHAYTVRRWCTSIVYTSSHQKFKKSNTDACSINYLHPLPLFSNITASIDMITAIDNRCNCQTSEKSWNVRTLELVYARNPVFQGGSSATRSLTSYEYRNDAVSPKAGGLRALQRQLQVQTKLLRNSKVRLKNRLVQ